MTIQTSFSYDNYPNLWDEILAYASSEAKRDVRPVSRALRTAIDRRVRHLVLTAGPPSGSSQGDVAEGAEASAYDWRSGQSAPTFPALQHLSAWGEEEEWAPWGMGDDLLVPPWKEQRSLTCLTRVVDLRGYFHQWLHLGRIGHLFPNIDTLRLTQDKRGTFFYYVPFAANTLVLFPSPKGLAANRAHPVCMHLTGVGDEDDDQYDDEWNAGVAPAWGPEPPCWPEPPNPPAILESMLPEAVPDVQPPLDEPRGIPAGVKCIVVNFSGHVGNAAGSFHFLYDLQEEVEEVVFFLPHLSALSDTGSTTAAYPMDLVEIMRSPTARHTVVGAECCEEDFANKVREALKVLSFNVPHMDVDYSIDDELTRGMSAWHRTSLASRGRVLRERAAFRAARQGRAGPGSPRLSLQQKIDDRLGRLEFVTVEEYRKRVGDETAMLHMVQYPAAQTA